MVAGAMQAPLLVVSAVLLLQSGGSRVVRIGAILSTPEDESALRLAVEYVNGEQILGPDLSLEQLTNQSAVISTFSCIQSACSLAAAGVMAYVGPISSTGTQAIAPISRSLQIPLITPTATNPMIGNKAKYPYVLRMVPPDTEQSMALVGLMEAFQWTRVAILTSNTDYGVNAVLKFRSVAARKKWRVLSVQHFEAAYDPDDTNATKQLKVIQSTGVRVVVLSCLSVFGLPVLHQASRLGMLDAGWAWIVTDGIAGQGAPMPASFAGLLGTRPASERGQLWDALLERWRDADPLVYPGTDGPLEQYSSSVIDSVLAFTYAVKDMYQNQSHLNVTQERLDCLTDSWSDGPTMMQYLKEVVGKGTASEIRFNMEGSPRIPAYDIVNLQTDGWVKVGEWGPTHGLGKGLDTANISLPGGQSTVTDYVSQLANRTLRAVLLTEKPFIMITNKNYNPRNINPEDVEGLNIDLLQRLAEVIGFNYTMYMAPDLQYGRKDPDTFQWDGLVGELVQRKADIAVAPLTINYPREKDADFTKPYLDLGMRVLMRVPPVEPPRPFRFLDPFQEDVWMMTLLMTFVVGVYVSLLNKLSPYDHHGRYVYRDYAQADKAGYKEYKKITIIKRNSMSIFSFSNAVWFSIATLLHQGGEAYPKSCSARVAMLTWLFAIVILVATYTANLAAFLTASRSKTSIESIEDLGAQTKVKYGTVRSSAPRQFFEDSNVTLYKDMLLYMTQQNTFVNQTAAGIAKARQGGYAFIFDSAVLDYVVENKPCGTLRNVGRLFGKIGYGLGLQKSSPYKEELSYHILRLREQGYMEYLVNKWYREKGECSQDNKGSSEHDKAIAAAGGKLGISQLLGVFFIVLGGICLSVIVLLLEWIVAVHSVVDKTDPLRPATFLQSLRQRMSGLLADFREEMAHLRHRKDEESNPREEPREINSDRSPGLKPYTTDSPRVIYEGDVVLTLAGSLAQRQRLECQTNGMTSHPEIWEGRENGRGCIYANPAFQSDTHRETL